MDTSNPNEKYFESIKRRFKLKNYIVYIFFILFLAVTIPLGYAGLIKGSQRDLFEQVGYTIIAVTSLSLVVGFLGELSLGHAGFMSIGAFVGMWFQQAFLGDLYKVSPLLSLIVAMIVGAIAAGIAGFIIGLPALRLKGDYLAIVTLAFGEIVKVIFKNINSSKYHWDTIGLHNSYTYGKFLFIVIIIVAFLSVILVKNLLKSKHGRAIMAIRDNEIAAKAMGVNVTQYKLVVFILSAVLAGIAGVLFGAGHSVISASKFDYNYSINNILVMVVIGGMGNINGSIASACVVPWISNQLQKKLTGNLAPISPILYAAIIILIVIYNNAPALKPFRQKYNFRKLFHKIKVFVKTKIFKKPITEKDILKEQEDIKDYGADWAVVPTKIPVDTVVSTDLELGYDENKPDKGGK